MNDLLKIGIWVLVIGAIFAILWRKGYLLKISSYVAETRDELKKCNWPSREEIKGSTVVVVVAIALIGAFTVGIDFVISLLMRLIV